MIRVPRFALPAVLCLLPAALFAQSPTLTIESAGPTGEIAKREQAKEIRIVFSEPMVELGKIPAKIEAPYFSMTPARAGAFRWAGTRTLIFTPAALLPWNTDFRVAVAADAASLAGHVLGKAYTFSFKTPSVRLLRASWYRKSGRFDSPVVLVLAFNQPVTAASVAKDVSLAIAPHDWIPPAPPAGADLWKSADAAGFAAYEAKVARARETAAAKGDVPITPASAWNRKWFPKSAETVAFQTGTTPPPGTSLVLRSGSKDQITLALEPVFFLEGFRCESACDPDDYNPLKSRVKIDKKSFAASVRIADVTEAGRETPVARRRAPKVEAPVGDEADEPDERGTGEMDSGLYPRSQEDWENRPEFWAGERTLDEAGFTLRPGRSYAVRVPSGLRSEDGQTLGYSWTGRVENWHQNAFTSFGAGHGVWESSGGSELPFHARNLKTATTWAAVVKPGDLMDAYVLLEKDGFKSPPDGKGAARRLAPVADKLQSYGLNLKPLLSASGSGIVWTALKSGDPIAKSHLAGDGSPSASLVQVTNLGISVKDSPDNTLIFVTRLDDGAAVPGAKVTIATRGNGVFWTGTTDADGIAVAPDTALRDPENWWDFRFLVTAEKDGDFAYVGSNWNQGSDPWAFGLNFRIEEALPLLRGSVFTDRGVYKLAEEVHFKAVVRNDTARGMKLLAKATPLKVQVTDSQGKSQDERTLPVSEWGTAEWTWKLPADAPLGTYTVSAGDDPKRTVSGSFLVAAFRRPDFRVDADVAADSSIAGGKLSGKVTARYLFGAAMADRPVRWSWSRRPLSDVPAAIAEKFPEERWEFLGDSGERRRKDFETIESKEGKLDSAGQAKLDLTTRADSPFPFDYTLEGEVTDVSRQRIAGRASFRVDPAPWYIGVKRLSYFAEAGKSVETAVVAADLSGKPAAGVKVAARLVQVQWHAVRRAEGRGFYTWETQRKEVEAGRFEVTTGEEPAALSIPVPHGGYYVLTATAKDAQGRSTRTTSSFYALGGGYTAWERYDHNRIDLVPEKTTYRPGDVARILVKSPWEKATALLTTEREGVRTHKTFALTSTQQTVSVPIGEDAIPNVYVSVLLVKGRTGSYAPEDASDPGKPAFRLGYAELKVENAAKRLSVAVEADRAEYRPGDPAHVRVAVADAKGNGDSAEITLWAVDYGILSLTGYKTPDLIGLIYVPKALSVLNEDSRINIVSRRAVVPKGGAEGGGGGEADGPGTPVRKDFRVLAFWLGSLVTDANGRAAADVKLPESLTTYRIMAVAGDQASRFGRGEKEIVVRKPVLLTAAFPRFLSVGDAALFGAVLHSSVKEKGTAVVTMKSLDPGILEVAGDGRQSIEVASGQSPEIRFPIRAKAPGVARVNMSVRLGAEADAFEEKIPVELVAVPEVVAASGRTTDSAHESVSIPAGALPDFGGLRIELASTALVNLSEGARYLVDYPYGCAEQRSSAALALMLAADLGRAFRISGLAPDTMADTAKATVAELSEFQCESGGFAFWKKDCATVSPYLTAYVVSVLQRAKKLDYPVADAVLPKAYAYLEKSLGEKPPENAGWMPAHSAWQAFALKVLAEGGRPVDSPVARLFESLDRMPVFGLAYLWDAVEADGKGGPRAAELKRRIENAILPENATAHVEELADPELLWFWNSNVRSTAIALGALVRHAPESPHIPKMVRWLLDARKNGRWGNTQENASAMGALVDYYRKFEAQVPAFEATAKLAGRTLASEKFQGRSAEARVRETPMRDLVLHSKPSESMPLELSKSGIGTLFWSARLTSATAEPKPDPLDAGIHVERSYAPGGSAGGATADAAAGAAGPPPVPAPATLSGTAFAAGALVRVTLTLSLTKERRFVAVTDPLPAGFEPVESWFATTASDMSRAQELSERGGDWMAWWQRGGFDRVERHDDRVLLFATRLSEGVHTYSYLARATTAGTFRTSPTRAEEMYAPEVFGRTASVLVVVEK